MTEREKPTHPSPDLSLRKTFYITTLVLVTTVGLGFAQNPTAPTDSLPDLLPRDSIRLKSGRRPLLRLPDRYSNRFSQPIPGSPFAPRDPRSLQTQFQFDSSGRLSIYERLAPGSTLPSIDYRPAETITLDQYRALQNRRAYQDLLRGYESRADGKSETSGRGLFPKFNMSAPGLDRIFGASGIEFKPNGSVLLDLGFYFKTSTTRPFPSDSGARATSCSTNRPL